MDEYIYDGHKVVNIRVKDPVFHGSGGIRLNGKAGEK